MKLFVVLFAFVAFLEGARADPAWFVGGNFERAHGLNSPNFIRYGYGDPEPGFQRLDPTGVHYEDVWDMSGIPGREGVFVVGAFDTIGNVKSSRAAYFNGQSWCAIRDGLNGDLQKVKCITANDCYVVGAFTSVANGGEVDPARFIAHYTYNEDMKEWRFSEDLEDWSVNGTNAPPSGWIEKFDIVRNDASGGLNFFVLINGEIYRGSRPDDGWHHLTSDIGNIFSFSIFGTKMYVVSGNELESPSNMFGDGESITWDQVISNYNPDGKFFSLRHVHAFSDTERYLACRFAENAVSADSRWYVCRQSGSSEPEPIGLPFHESMSDSTSYPFWEVYSMHGSNQPLVFGAFPGANWVENSDDSFYKRPLDAVSELATWDPASSSWVHPFGGGFDDDLYYFALSQVDGQTFYYFLGEFDFGYDLLAHGGAWYDDAVENTRPWFPLIYHALHSREAELETLVTKIHYSEEDSLAYVVGHFDYVGNDTRGSIFSTAPATALTQFTTNDVGGGVWNVDYDSPLSSGVYLSAGIINDLTFGDDGELYVAGYFSRSVSGRGLRNVAVLNSASGEFESLGGGCNDVVNKLTWWNDMLILVGSFTVCGGRAANHIAAWTGTEYISFNTGTDRVLYTAEPFLYGGVELLAVGGAHYVSSGHVTYGVSVWDGEKWTGLQNGCDDASCTYVPNKQINTQLVQVHDLLWDSTNSKLYAFARIRSDSPLFASYERPVDSVSSTTCDDFTECDQLYWTTRHQVSVWANDKWTILSTASAPRRFVLGFPDFPLLNSLAMNDTRLLGTWASSDYLVRDNAYFGAFDVVLQNHVHSHFNTDNHISCIAPSQD